MVAGELAGVEAAEAPADDQDRLLVAEAFDPLADALDRVGPGAEVPAHLPAVDPKARRRQLLAQRQRGLVAAQEAGDDQHRRSVLRPARAALGEVADEAHAFHASSRRCRPVGGASSPSQTGVAFFPWDTGLEKFIAAH